MQPDFEIPGDYDVTFLRKRTNPVSPETLRQQVREMGLNHFDVVIGLGGKEYEQAISAAFAPFGIVPRFPFAGLGIGARMHAATETIRTGRPAGEPC